MLERLTRYWVAKFTNKLLASVDLYKLINEIHEIHETLDTKIHNTQINLDNLTKELETKRDNLFNISKLQNMIG